MVGAFNKRQSREWERTRNLEFTLYNVQHNAMSGKKLFKNLKRPKDLYRLPTDYTTVIKIDKERQAAAVERVKNSKSLQKWVDRN